MCFCFLDMFGLFGFQNNGIWGLGKYTLGLSVFLLLQLETSLSVFSSFLGQLCLIKGTPSCCQN